MSMSSEDANPAFPDPHTPTPEADQASNPAMPRDSHTPRGSVETGTPAAVAEHDERENETVVPAPVSVFVSVSDSDSDADRRLSWDASALPGPLGCGFDSEATVVDWSGNGPLDLLVTSQCGPRGRETRLYLRKTDSPADAPVYAAGVALPELAGLRHLCAIERRGGPTPEPGASKFDLIGLDEKAGEFVWLANRGRPGAPEFGPRVPVGLPADLGIGPGRIAQMAAVDWDGDGRIDLLVGYDKTEGYWPDGDGIPPERQVGFNELGGHPGYDSRGHWRGRPARGVVLWIDNLGPRPEEADDPTAAPVFVVREEIRSDRGPLEIGNRPAPITVAWSGSGAIELLITDADNVVRLYRNFGGQRPPVLLEPRTLNAAGSGSGAFDAKPLKLDLARTNLIAARLLPGAAAETLVHGSADGRVRIIPVDPRRDEAGKASLALTDDPKVSFGGGATVAAGDLDADGDYDLVYGDPQGRIHYVEDVGEPGRPRYAAPIELEGGGLPFRAQPGPDGMLLGPLQPPLGHACPVIGDWNGNGRIDLLVATAGGEVLYLHNNGAVHQPRFEYPKPLKIERHPLIMPPRVRPAMVRWRPGELPDLIGLDLQGMLCVHRREETFELAPSVPLLDHFGRLIRLDGGYARAGRVSLWAGPFTDPELVDILVGLPAASRGLVPGLLGQPIEDLDDIPTVLLLQNTGHGRFIPRGLRTKADNRPLLLGREGCSPNGVTPPGAELPDLLVGADDGRVRLYRRDELAW